MVRIFLFLLGATLGSFYDGFHTHSGTTFYPHPWLWQMAWWTPPLFGAAALGIATTHVDLDRVLRRRGRTLTGLVVAGGIAYFGLFYFLSAYLPAQNGTKLGVLLAGWLALWLALDRTWQGVLLALLTAAAGCTVEMTLSRLGAFGYLHPDAGGIPCWLPALYGLASLSVGNLGRRTLGPAPRRRAA